MRFLLDTHVLIWWARREPLSEQTRDAVADPSNKVVVSAASIWEAEIKAAAGRLRLGRNLGREAEEHGFEQLAITFAHAAHAARLPPHHGDPFDRMLVAQAQLEGLTLATRDPVFDGYAVAVLRA
ncbi:MAG TPA: type II toxin-antitoxin system VapC family toxin [Thermoleophilaceae bacterium]|nr:type II toxin-antitoxin system VapC family toxin [Thermoleophilaceae bacterium]